MAKSVYMVLHTETEVLIAKKALVNNKWTRNGRIGYVRQGGQWGFPGGKIESSDLRKEAKREFQEETGIKINNSDFKNSATGNLGEFYVCFYLCDKPELEKYAKKGNSRIGIGMVKDLELSELKIVPICSCCNYLGVWKEIEESNKHAKHINSLRDTDYYAIDWYGRIGRNLQKAIRPKVKKDLVEEKQQ